MTQQKDKITLCDNDEYKRYEEQRKDKALVDNAIHIINNLGVKYKIVSGTTDEKLEIDI